MFTVYSPCTHSLVFALPRLCRWAQCLLWVPSWLHLIRTASPETVTRRLEAWDNQLASQGKRGAGMVDSIFTVRQRQALIAHSVATVLRSIRDSTARPSTAVLRCRCTKGCRVFFPGYCSASSQAFKSPLPASIVFSWSISRQWEWGLCRGDIGQRDPAATFEESRHGLSTQALASV